MTPATTIPIPDRLAPIRDAFSAAGVPVYAVGGLVRNAILRLPPHDIDVCSRLTPDEVAEMLLGADVHVVKKAARFGTVELHCAGCRVEHTTFRADVYPPGGAHRPDTVRFGDSLPFDALRRDFTVNALYADLSTGQVVDPTGGLLDLKDGLLRAASTPADRTLGSDALRILRMVRFGAELGFAVERETFQAAARHAHQLSAIAPERIQAELSAILLCEQRYPQLPPSDRRSVLSALMMMDELDVWDAVMPPLRPLRNLPQRKDHHRYDALTHSFHVCACMPPDLTMRLAGLLHDIGKPACRAETGNFHLHDRYGAPMAREALTHLRYPAAVTGDVCNLVLYHMYDVQNAARDDTLRTRFALWGRTLTQRMIVMREADVRGCGYDTEYVNARWRTLYQTMQDEGAPFDERELAVTGKDIMRVLGIPPGPQVGQIKQTLLLHCARRPADNTAARLTVLMRDCTRGQGTPAVMKRHRFSDIL